MTTALYLEDFRPGAKFRTATHTVDAAQIKEFARQFDPQPFHTDEVAAAKSFFKGLAASGWHTAAMTMRLLATGEMQVPGGLIGAGAEELRWTHPVRPGDVLHVETEVLSARVSKSRPEQGIVKVRIETFNQDGTMVQSLIVNMFVPRRPAAT